jgi:hypothetical protein
MGFPVNTGILHLASAAAVWASMVAFTVLAYQTADRIPVSGASQKNESSGPLRLVGNLFLLTKPWITALLLATTLGAMMVAARGLPPLGTIFFTLLGGALCASGSSARRRVVRERIERAEFVYRP